MKLPTVCATAILVIFLVHVNSSCSKQIEKTCSSCPSPKPERPVDIEATKWVASGDSSLYWCDFSDTLLKRSGGYNYIIAVYMILGGSEINLNQPYDYGVGEIICEGTHISYTPWPHAPLPFKTIPLKVIVY